MPDIAVTRGQIWWVDIGLDQNKRFVVVSNNARNRALGDVVMVRLTTADKPDIPSIVEFGAGEISESRCFAVADDVWMIGKRVVARPGGRSARLSQMERVSQALRVALDL